MNVPIFSVIIPAYNAEPWIRTTIGSVLQQTVIDLEVIVVNDGSTDRTGHIARSIEDPRVRVIDQNNAGVSAARNTGLRAAHGMFISFLDADDAMLPENLAVKRAELEREGVDWVYGDLMLCNEGLIPTGELLKGADGDVVRTILLGTDPAVPAPCSNILAHRRCFTSGIQLDEQLSNAADQDLALRLAKAHNHYHIHTALTLYRVLPGSMSRNIKLYQDDHLLLMRKAVANGMLDEPAFRRRCLANAYWSIAGSWWVNANKWYRAVPFLLKAICLRPSLAFRPIRSRFPAFRRSS